MTELKPCPFCGGEADISRWGGFLSQYYYIVQCKECVGMVMTKPSVNASEAEAIEAWNRRAE